MSVLAGNVLLTGATGGIGQATARALAARGAKLVLTGRRANVLEALAREVGGRALVCDFGDHDDVERLIQAAGEVDVVIANAAMPGSGHVLALAQDQIDRMLEVNLRAPIRLARAFGAGMAERGRGHLVFISSLNGKAATPRTAMYCAAKFGLRGFALALRDDLAPDGVGVSLVYPGFVRDAGMFVESGVRLPRYVATRSPEQVAGGVLRAIEQNRAEVTVAPALLRVSTTFASLLPQLASSLSRRLGGEKLAIEIAEGQAGKR